MVITYESELYHYGVKGMKWGVRKQRGSSSNSGNPKAKGTIGKAMKVSSPKSGGGASASSTSFANVNKMSSKQASEYGKKAAAGTTKEERAEYIKAFDDMLDKDPEHYFPDFIYDVPEPKVNGKDASYYQKQGWDEYKKYLNSPEYQKYEADYEKASKKFYEPYQKESDAASDRLDSVLNNLTTKYMGLDSKSPYANKSDSEVGAIKSFTYELENLYYDEDMSHSAIGKMMVGNYMDVDENELYHFGVKGMRWGHRKAYPVSASSRANFSRRQYMAPIGPRRAVSKQKAAASQDTLNKASKLSKDLGAAVSKKRPAKKMDLSSMSDEELRNAINRKNMERQYADLVNSESVSSGRAHVGEVLETVGTVLGIGASAVGLALSIQQLRKGGGD